MAEPKAGVIKDKTKEVFCDESARFNLSSKYYQEVPRQNITFINLTTSSGTKQDADKRRLVRSQAIRNAHQQKQLKEYGKEQVHRVILPSNIPVVQGGPAIDPAGMPTSAQHHGAEPEFNLADKVLDGNTPTTSVPRQGMPALTPAEASWLPKMSVSADLTVMPTAEMTSESDSGLDKNYGRAHKEDGNAVGWLVGLEEQSLETFSPQLSQYPLISPNIEPASPSRGRIDPFDTMPALQNSQSQALMYHYTQVLVRSMLSVAVDPDDKWFGYSVTDAALFHSTMLHSAAHNAMLTGNTEFADPVSLKWEAIKLVNDRLGDPVLSLSDATIGAVAALLLFENQSANIEISNIHMNGLCQMVRLRGGLQHLGFAGILRRKVLWADLCNSMYSHSKPRFNNKNNSSPSKLDLNERDITQANPMSTVRAWHNETMEILSSLRSLSALLAGPFSRTAIAIDEIYSLERRIVVLLAETNPGPQSGSNQNSDEQSILLENRRITYQISLAAMMYIYLFLRDTLVPSPIFSVLVARFSSSLYSSYSNDDHKEDDEQEILFWALVVGVLATGAREEGHRFVMHLKTLCNLLSVRAFTDFVERLQEIAWIEKKSDDKLLQLWAEIQGF